MGVERMNCCGALTAVYRDQGNRKHNPDCTGRVEKRPGRRIWSALERLWRLSNSNDKGVDKPTLTP